MRFSLFWCTLNVKTKGESQTTRSTLTVPLLYLFSCCLAIIMWSFLNEQLLSFRSCFNRVATFPWFIIVILGFILRQDYLGVTSIIRSLAIVPSSYDSLLHFFHTSSWNLAAINQTWIGLVANSKHLTRVNGKAVLVGDGSK